MKRLLVTMMGMGLLAALVSGCVGKKEHPVRVIIDPDFKARGVEKIAVFPFASSLHHSDDPDGRAPETMDNLFRSELDMRNDYNFIAPGSVMYALEGADLVGESERFVRMWSQERQVDKQFLSDVSHVLQVDAVLIGVVDTWQKDEVDYRENASASTTVGATITVFGTDGKILFEASDEDFLEAPRSETTDRRVATSGLGAVRSDPGGVAYAAPEHEEVAIKVARALARSLPPR